MPPSSAPRLRPPPPPPPSQQPSFSLAPAPSHLHPHICLPLRPPPRSPASTPFCLSFPINSSPSPSIPASLSGLTLCQGHLHPRIRRFSIVACRARQDLSSDVELRRRQQPPHFSPQIADWKPILSSPFNLRPFPISCQFSTSYSSCCSSKITPRFLSLNYHATSHNNLHFERKLTTTLLSKPHHFHPLKILARCRRYLSRNINNSSR